ncbi:putative dipeptidyl aminopeptidase [Moniliophthora roreri]|nr:putative dipeptidyl aminopeptidase [Moniliophthora roreri]
MSFSFLAKRAGGYVNASISRAENVISIWHMRIWCSSDDNVHRANPAHLIMLVTK